jgi:hypothetical protein
VLQSVVEYYRVLQSVTECCRVLQSVAECCRVLQSVTECCRVLQSVVECYESVTAAFLDKVSKRIQSCCELLRHNLRLGLFMLLGLAGKEKE